MCRVSRLINTYWAVWLPAGASAFNVVLVEAHRRQPAPRASRQLRIDGAGPIMLFSKLVLPMSKTIPAFVSVFAVLARGRTSSGRCSSLTDPNKQTLSVRLPTIQSQTELGVFLAAMFIACLVPVAGFLIFQRSFLRGNGLGGAIKG